MSIMVEITDKEMYHVKVAAICQIIMNIISYTHADNLMLIITAGYSQLMLHIATCTGLHIQAINYSYVILIPVKFCIFDF